MFGDHVEDAGGQVGWQRGGHLVEEQDVWFDGQRPRQVDHPQCRQRQVASVGAQVEVVDPQVRQPGAECFDRGLGQREVLRNGQVRDDRRLLIDRHHAGASRLCRRGDVAFLAPQSNRAAIGPDGARQDLDQRALAGSICAHEGVNFAGSYGKRCVAQCGHRAVALLDAGRLEQELRHRLRFPLSGIGRERRHRAGAPVIGVRRSEGQDPGPSQATI